MRPANNYQGNFSNVRMSRMPPAINTVNSMNRRPLNSSFNNVYGKQQQRPQNTQVDGLVEHYSKIIDELKEENKRMKDILESIIKQKDFYTQSILEEHKKIIEDKNEFIVTQSKLIVHLEQRSAQS